MFELINKKFEQGIRAPFHEMSEEERGLQHEKIDRLQYIAALLERISWQLAPGKMEFPEYRKMVREFEENAGD